MDDSNKDNPVLNMMSFVGLSQDFNQKGNQYIQMTWNLLGRLKTKLVYRLDVDFHITAKNVDDYVGRTAHMKLLDNEVFIDMLVHRYKDFLC